MELHLEVAYGSFGDGEMDGLLLHGICIGVRAGPFFLGNPFGAN